MPKISVVMPTRNQVGFIGCAVDAVLAQTFPDFELIIINNGSTDGTTEYLDGLRDPRIIVRHREDRGALTSIDDGCRMASGEFLTWVSSDNVCAPYFLEALLAPFAADPGIGFSYSSYWTIDDRNALTGLNNRNLLRYRDLVFNRNAGCPAFLYRRALHETVGWYDVGMRFSGDTEMWARIFRIARVAYVVEPTHYYRMHDGQETKIAERTDAFAKEGRLMLDRYWQQTMHGSLSAVIEDLYPRLPTGCRDVRYFFCVWSLAANFYYYTDPGAAWTLMRFCLSLTPPEHLAAVLQFAAACAPADSIDAAQATILGALRANPQIDQARAEALAASMLAAKPPARSPIVTLPRADLAECFEREPPAAFSFLAQRHALPPLAGA